MREAADLIVVGGGPAGAAAGITALGRGLRVALFEAARYPRDRPGETLHPGVAPILSSLGILEAAESSAAYRPAAQRIVWGGPPRLEAYGTDARGDWRAFQLSRRTLNRLLLERFVALGGRLVQPAPPLLPLLANGKVGGVIVEGTPVSAPLVIDASGARGFLRRILEIGVRRISPLLVAHYGYRRGTFGEHPLIQGDRDGWSWVAQVDHDLVAWVRLPLGRGKHRPPVPAPIASLPDAGGRGAADVTWRMADRMAGPGWFLVGEAASVLDPAASHGILRALMSGMMAAHNAAELLAGATDQKRIEHGYGAWLQSWFQLDAARLLALYHDLGVDWRCVADESATASHCRRR